jgi:hypothetical protein
VLYRKITTDGFGYHIKRTNSRCGQNAESFNVKPGGTQNNIWALKGSKLRWTTTRKDSTGSIVFLSWGLLFFAFPRWGLFCGSRHLTWTRIVAYRLRHVIQSNFTARPIEAGGRRKVKKFKWHVTRTSCTKYKVVQIWPGQTVTCLHTNSHGHIWTTLYFVGNSHRRARQWEIRRYQ